MTPESLSAYRLLYLATVYTRFPDGLDEAFVQACEIAGKLLIDGVHVYSPIVHCHSIAYYAGVDPCDDELWTNFNETMLERSEALLVAKMESWRASRGIRHEIEVFQDAHKPIYYLDTETYEVGISAFT